MTMHGSKDAKELIEFL